MALSVIPDLGYRLLRLRRLLALQAGLQGAGLAIALTYGDPAHASGLGLAVGIAVLCVSWLSLRFPHGGLETIWLSVVLGGLWASAPGWFAQGIEPFVVISMGLTALMAWLSLTWLLGTYGFGLFPRQRTITGTIYMPHPKAAVRDALFPAPGFQDETCSYGHPDANGFVPIHYHFIKGEHSDIDPNTVETPVAKTGYAKILEETETSVTQLTVLETSPGVQATGVTVTSFREEGGGTWVTTQEVSDMMCWMSALGFWATDFSADWLTHVSDTLSGMPPRALKVQPMDTPMTVLAKLMSGEVPQNPPN